MNLQYVLNPYARPQPPWATWSDGFSPAELDILQNYAINADIPANVGGNNNTGRVDNDIRRSKVKWMSNDNQYNWVFHRLGHIISSLNAEFYQFDLTGFGEALQLTNYSENDHGMYGWHQDGGSMNLGPCRKFSLVMQLTDPSSYEGGNLEVMDGGRPRVVEKKRGLITVFPSWTLHQVTPVTRGSRQSLVLWVTGPQFK